MYLGPVFSTDIQRHKTGASLIPCPSLSLRLSPLPVNFMFCATGTGLYTTVISLLEITGANCETSEPDFLF